MSQSAKMLLMKLGSELLNLVKKYQPILNIWTKCRLNFHEVECIPSHPTIRHKSVNEIHKYIDKIPITFAISCKFFRKKSRDKVI